MLKRIVLMAAALLGPICHSPLAAPITASVSGSTTPTPVPAPGTITNGDFTISDDDSGSSTLVGDGSNDVTTWTFDFTSDPDFVTFPFSDPLTTAMLTLTLRVTDAKIFTDVVRIEGLADITTPAIQTLSFGETATVELELLNFYSSASILSVLTGGTNGQLPMHYSDDAILTAAALRLDTSPFAASEPSALLLLGFGVACVVVYGIRRRTENTAGQ